MAKGEILVTWILVNSQSNLKLFKNKDILAGIRKVGNQANVYTYAGMNSTKQVKHQPLFKMDSWFNPHNNSNIISLEIVTKNYPVAFNKMEIFFTDHLQDQDIMFRHVKAVTFLEIASQIEFDRKVSC